MREALDYLGLTKVRVGTVGTVDKFGEQEAVIAVLTLTAPSACLAELSGHILLPGR